jgi:hypothetical protein
MPGSDTRGDWLAMLIYTLWASCEESFLPHRSTSAQWPVFNVKFFRPTG